MNRSSTKSTKESKLGAFLRGSFLRSTSSSQSVVTSKSKKKSSSSSKEWQGRERTPRISSCPTLNEQSSASRTQLAGTLPTEKSLSNSTHKSSRSKSDLRLRSKSPSRQRIEQFMEEVRARERSRSSSRDRHLQMNTSRDNESQSRATKYSPRASSQERPGGSSMNSPVRATRSMHVRSSTKGDHRSLDARHGGSSQKRLQLFLESRKTTSCHANSPSIKDSSSEENSVDGKSLFSSGTKSTGMSKNSSYHIRSPLANRTPSNQQPKGSPIPPNSPSMRSSPVTKRPSTMKASGFISPVSTMVHPSTNSDDPEAWFGAIGRRDWITAEQLIRSYDFKKYRPYNSATRKPAKKLRVLKYLPSKDRKGEEDEQVGISPLLLGDSQGRTPLHLACKEFMPWKLLQSLFFLERNAVFVTDDDGRLPLHLALIASHDIRILDRLIHAHPASLLHPDKLARTPMGYAILRAEHKRDKAIQGTWRIPTQQEQRDWQTQQAENWKNVQFLLDAFVARRKLLSKDHEAPLLIHALEAFAPPSVMNDMLSVSARILQQDDVMAERLLQMLVSLEYPIAIIHKALKICLEIIPRTQLMSCIRRGMMEHYDRGCFPCYQGVCFRTDLLQAYKRKQVHQGELVLGDATQEWWDMLKFLIGFSSSASLKTHTLDETYLLHASLLIPDSPARLVELLVRLFPHARFEEDPETNALPIHLACQYWNSNGKRNYEYSMEKSIVLKMMVTGDSTLVRKRYHRRYPLHLAILSGQSWRFIQTILSLHPKVLSVPDHWTRLYPFQLAAMNISSEIPDPKYNTNDRSSPSDSTFGDRNENHQLDMIYQLLRMNPVAVSPILSCGSGDPSGDLGLVAQHVLSWCYSYKNHGWILNQPRSEALRWAISEGVMPKSRSIIIWFNQLKVLIWKMYDLKNTDKRIAYMPHEDVYLLHAALSHSGTPPIAIELMLMLFPKSIAIPIPGTDEYPIHLAAKSPSYAPMPFETVPITSILEMIILANPKTVSLVSNGRNILQIAIDAGKTWQELYPIVQNHRSLLKQRDPSTGLFPFQQVASCKSFLSLQDWMHVKTFAMKWTDRTPAENGLMIRRFQRKYQQEKTTTIFEMLRAQPRVLEMCTL